MKVHYKTSKGLPVCNCHKRWHSSFITTVISIDKVTCKRCINKIPKQVGKENNSKLIKAIINYHNL